ncbi:glycosyltransferase family 4 protein [Candidatus Woesebacteria bacterium]|nr:glycosyltransferase family 4 protein [Candidatus Woesebacteria bacterium]
MSFFSDHFKRKDYWQLHFLTQYSGTQGQHIFAISEATKNDVIEQYRRDPEDVTVVYPAAPRNIVEPSAATRQAVRERFGIQKPFLVYVGTVQPRKNIDRLVGAFEVVRQNGWDGELVLAGKIGWKSDSIVQRIETSSARDHIRQLGFVTDEEKYALLMEAEMLVLPGLYEGFGIPPLEALLLGTIPVVSDASSLPEVVGESGIKVDPESVEDIARGIEEVLACSPAEKKKMIAALQVHASQFSWEKSGALVGETLWKLLSHTHAL